MKALIRYIAPALGVLAIFLTAGASTADAQILREILDRMDNRYKALSSLRANVSRVQANPQIGTSDDSSGNVVLVPKGGRDVSMLLKWTRPREETLSVTNGKYQLYVPAIKRAYRGSTKSQKVDKSGGGVLKVLTMSEQELRANYTVRYLGQVNLDGTEVWHLGLDPKARQSFKKAELWVNKDGMPIQAKIIAHNDETDTLRISSVVENEDVDADVFKVKVRKGTEIIEQ